MQAYHWRLIMRYNQHCVILLISFILLIYYLQQVTISTNPMSEDEIFRTGRRVLLKDRINLRQFRTRTSALKKVVDSIAGRQPNHKSAEAEKSSTIKSSNTLVYNRIDKAGSTTLIKTLEKMSYRNSFFLIGHGNPNLRFFDTGQKRDLADIFCKEDSAIIYTRHLYYTNFSESGCNVQYFNIMRDPASRFLSRYTWYREVYEMKKEEPYFGKQGKDRSKNINDCILLSHEECQYRGVLSRMLRFFRVDSQIPYFCGDSERCRTIGSREALEKAKENIRNSFLMVGVLEELDKTHYVLECLKPNLFQGLADQHKKQDLHVHSQHKATETISHEAMEKLKKMLEMEYELYDFVIERLQQQYEDCKYKRIR